MPPLLNDQLHELVTAAVVIVVMAHATYTDLKRREIENYTVLLGGAAGLLLWGLHRGVIGLGLSALGFALGFGTFLLMGVMGGMEGGDIKLMGALGCLLGWPTMLSGLLHVVLAGFLLALFWVVIEGNLGRTLKNIWTMLASWLLPKRRRVSLEELETSTLPYGVAIALGAVYTIIAVRFPIIDLLQVLR